MSVIIPAVLVPTRKKLEETLARLVDLPIDTVQIDVVDGRFAGSPTWPYAEGGREFASMIERGETLPYGEHFRFEMDLMVADPEQVTGMWIAAGATKILAHVESTHYLPRLITDLTTRYGHEKGFAPGLLSFGLALNVDTELSALEPYLENADYVQFMGIASIGRQGQPFDRRVLRKIETFRRSHPDIPVQVDGGVSLLTAAELLAVGVSRLCVGSALLGAEDIAEEFHKFEAIAEQYGRYK